MKLWLSGGKMGVQAGEVEMFPILTKVWVELPLRPPHLPSLINQHVTVTPSTSILG